MKMPTYLDAILERKREDLVAAKLATPLADLKARVAGLSQPLDFPAALRRPGVQVIAEIKKASPSRGVMLGATSTPDRGIGCSVQSDISDMDGPREHVR